MRLFHKGFAAALLCGAVGFALPSYAADYSSGTANSSSTTPSSTKALPSTPTLCTHHNPVIPTEADQAKRRSAQWRDLVFPISKVNERSFGWTQ